ncbi:MAG: branched-chain amino acid transport system ATP-binding protein [Actinomycetota bacterium]|jgi:branched-chain amino acid transport system ATP-binding protein|nr:branched-chain amino acid transport system ATP-binding protein [Actinomycetota bacterium]
MPVLDAVDVSIRFGGLQALRDVNLTVNEFEIVGLIGPNGAGKTTIFNCITGFYRPNTGRVVFQGTDVSEMGPHERSALGMGRTFQNVGLVKTETVMANMLTAQHSAVEYGAVAGLVGSPTSWRAERVLRRRADAILDILSLGHLRDSPVKGLPYGTLKRVEIATALATDPDLLMLDEPGSGMGPDEAHRLGDELLELRREFDLTIIMIEHHVPLVVRVCDYVYVLNFGELLTEGLPDDVRRHPEVVAAYLGEEAPEAEAEAERRQAGREGAQI